LERKLTAIFCADVFGYSRLTGENEEATHLTLRSYRKLIDAQIEQHHGRFVHSAGDSVLAEFVSVVNAVQCAVEIQTALKAENAMLPTERRMEFRIGINLGDVIADGVEIYGDGVNVAARLESLADPGAIFISGSVREQLGNKLPLGYADLGEQAVKNIAHPVRVFRVLEGGANEGSAGGMKAQAARKYPRRGAFSIVGLGIIVATIVIMQHVSLKALRTSASIPPPEKPALTSPTIPSIAVLPFVNLSGDPNQEYFSDGITDELITMLSRLSHIIVISRTSTFTYKGRQVRPQEIGRELGAKYLLEGSATKSAKQVRVEARLVEAQSGTEMWADHFDRPLSEIFALQDQIVQAIVTTLDLQMKLVERGVWERVRLTTNNTEAYDDVLRGLVYRWRENKEDDAKALKWFEKAAEVDPNYIDAYVLMSATIFHDWDWQWTQDPHALERSLALVQKALELDDSHPTAHVIEGRIRLEKGQFDAAASETERGIALAPNDTGNYYCSASGNVDWAADTLNWSGKPAEALEVAERAIRQDPERSDFHLHAIGVAYYKLGRPAEAIEPLKRFIEAYPVFPEARYILTASYVELGMMEQARAESARVLKSSPGFSLEAGIFKGLEPQDRLISDLRKAGLK
jgi:adenylate cyclase